jgi:hypothetical protein
MDQLSVALARFASNVVAAQAGTGKQAAALQALGFNAQTFAKQFATTDQALLAVAQRLNQYADGLGKTAIEQDLLGKSGAQFAAFLRELAERGTDSVKVTTEQALAARQLEDSITKLKSSFTDLVNRLATTLVPVLRKVVDGMDTFKTIAIAAIGAFVVWPATLTAATATVIAFREAIALTTIYNNLFGVSLQNIYAALGGIRLPAELAAGGLAALRASALLLFAAFAGWEIGKFLSDNFLQAKLAGYAFVDSMLTAWENVKYAGQVAWAFLQFAFEQAIESMRQSFGSFIAWVAQGLSHIPGAAGIAEAVQGFAATVAGPTGQALADFNAKLAQLGKSNTDAKAKIHDITTDLMAYAIAADAGGAASARAAKAPPPVPAAAAQAVRDLTAAIDAYLKSEAALQKAFIDATAARLLQANEEQQADLKRSYDRGLVDFEAYWNKLTALQQQAIGVQIVQTQSEIANQQALVAQLQDSATKAATVLNGLTPGTKAYADAQAAALKVQTDLDNANAKLITSTGKLNGLQEKGTQIGKDYVEQWNAAHNVIAASVSEINKQIEAQTFANQTIGLAASQVALLKAAELQEALALEIAGQNRAAQVKNLEDQIAAQQRLSAALKQGEDTQALLDSIRSIDQEAQRVWEDLFNGGHDAFKRLGDDIKKYLIDLLYQLTIKPLIVNIAANVLGVNQAQAAGAAGLGSNPILNLLGGNGGSTLLSRGVNSFVTSDVGATMGLSTAVPNAAVGSAESSLFGAAAGTSNVATGLGSLLTSVAPYIPFVAAAIPLLGSLFSHDPSQVHARFNITPTGTGAGTNEGGAGGTVASPYGDLGFNNADTMYFSGSAGTALSNIVLGALQAFQPRLSTEQNQRLTQTLQSTNFGTFEGSYTTEDFIKQYGGDILKKVVVAAFHDLSRFVCAAAARSADVVKLALMNAMPCNACCAPPSASTNLVMFAGSSASIFSRRPSSGVPRLCTIVTNASTLSAIA